MNIEKRFLLIFSFVFIIFLQHVSADCYGVPDLGNLPQADPDCQPVSCADSNPLTPNMYDELGKTCLLASYTNCYCENNQKIFTACEYDLTTESYYQGIKTSTINYHGLNPDCGSTDCGECKIYNPISTLCEVVPNCQISCGECGIYNSNTNLCESTDSESTPQKPDTNC